MAVPLCVRSTHLPPIPAGAWRESGGNRAIRNRPVAENIFQTVKFLADKTVPQVHRGVKTRR
jgi:hypothetical protein